MKDVVFDDSYHVREIEVDPSWEKDFGKDYFAYRKKWKLAGECRLFDFPLFLEVESTYACNYRCPKCPRQHLKSFPGAGSLSDGLFDKLFSEAKKHCLPSITFSHGGEPLMRNDLAALMRKAKEAGIIDRMFHTNGYLLTKEISRDLIRSGLTKINFSLDAACAKTYDKVRPGGNYEKVVFNIFDFISARKEQGKSYPRIRVSFVVGEDNISERQAFYDFWKDKANVISFQQCYDFSRVLNPEAQVSPDKLPAKGYSCSMLWQLLTITCEGDILVCEHDYNHDYVLGNLKTHSIHECWHSERMSEFRRLHLNNEWHKIPICRKCVGSVRKEPDEL